MYQNNISKTTAELTNSFMLNLASFSFAVTLKYTLYRPKLKTVSELIF